MLEGPQAIIKVISTRFKYRCAVYKKNRLCSRKRGASHHILYILGDVYGESKRYRVYNVLEAVSLLGVTGRVTTTELLWFHNPKSYDIVVFFRCVGTAFTNKFLARCKKTGVPTVYDIDDLIFDPLIADQVQALQHTDTALAIEWLRSHKEFMDACDYVTASTQYLCDYISKMTLKKTFLIRNGLNHEQIKIASEIGQPELDECLIGFLSGSKTHDSDFEQAAPALENVMSRYIHIKLVVIGPVELPDCIEKFHDRIRRIPFMDYRDLLYTCSRLYTVIVPLEYKTAFCNAKSELKYFEQALIGVPVIASPTAPYQECITHDVNGLLAKDTAEWIDALGKLIDDPDFHDILAKNAKNNSFLLYSPDIIGLQAKTIYDLIVGKDIFS